MRMLYIPLVPAGDEPPLNRSKFDLTLWLEDQPGEMVGHLEYNSDLFESHTIDRLIRDYRFLLEYLRQDPEEPLHGIELPV